MFRDILPKSFPQGKRLLDAIVMPAIVVLVGIGAFGLGRLSAIQGQESVKVYAPTQTAQAEAAVETRVLAQPQSQGPVTQVTTAPAEKNFVASKNGTKYYPAGCAGASRIKQENEVWFSTSADAQDAGYSLAANCK